MKISRQAKSIAAIRAARRADGQCAGCGAVSKTFWCGACRPRTGGACGKRKGAGRPPKK
jgi:hypothetical protein